MLNLTRILLFLLLQYTKDSEGIFLRVETGHQNIAIDGRDTYYGHYTKIHFHNVTCLDSIDIHCLKELTGAEEIDLLYTQCQKGHWKVAHYTNSKHHFRLKEPIHALRLLISSRRELSVIDAQVGSCSYPPAPPSDCHRPTRNHNHRHGKPGQILRAVDPYSQIEMDSERKPTKSRRYRRSLPEGDPQEKEVLKGEHEFQEDKIITSEQLTQFQPGSILKFHKNAGLVVNGVLVLRGKTEQPIILEAAVKGEKWRGIEFRGVEGGSELTHVKISGSDVAISVNGGEAPIIDHVVADGNTYGIQITDLSPNSTTHLKSVTTSNNEKTGVEYLGKGAISFDRMTSASNGGLGMFIATPNKVTIRRSSASSNNGTGIYVGSSEVTLEDVVLNANGFYGLHAEVERRLEMDGVNISAHREASAVELFLSAETESVKIGIANSLFHDNKKGGVRFSGSFRSPRIILRSCRFSRNAGQMIEFNRFGNSSLIVDKCSFMDNQYVNYDRGDSVISLRNVEGTENSITVSNCQFKLNTANDVIKILDNSTSSALPTTHISISSNEFIQNLANSAISSNFPNVSITGNRFQDRRADCEITYLLPATPKHEDIVENTFVPGNQNPTCTGRYQIFQMDQPATTTTAPEVGITENPFKNENGIIRASQEPYLINEEVVIQKGETVVIEPGTILDFAPGVGITVSGRLVMNGTEEQPIVTRGQNGNNWRGVVAKPEGVLDVINVVSEDASIGIWIDSEKVRIENGRIVRPVVHGIEITQNSNDILDLGGVIIEDASESAIGVDERRDDVLIKNAQIKNGVGSGIDFMTPTGNIEIQNISIDNMGGYGIHISEFPSSPLHAVLLEDVSVTNQKKGHAGIMISGGWIENVGLHNMMFTGNSVPSLIVALDCNDGNEKLIRMENCTFERNTDIVQHIQLGNCANLQMEKNKYNENNADGIGSTLVITSDSSTRKKNGVMELVKNNFTGNGGIYSVTVDSNLHDVYFTDNILTGNENSGAVLKISGENTKIVTNNFDNRDSKYQIAYSDDLPIDATFNEWNGLTEEELLDAIDSKDGAILVHPHTIPTVTVDNQLDAFTTVVPVTVPDSLNAECAHLSYCSRRGTCRDKICVCPQGFIGFDCSIPLICNCSGNGLCNLLNVCMCNEGWTGYDCSIPKCKENCNRNGKCVSPNVCQCDAGWMGETCATSTCVDSQCLHGHCSFTSGLCDCESGWKGSRCQIPICTNCTLNGVCTKPGYCDCFEDFGGSNCSKCVGDSCEPCDFDCNHGLCEPLTKTCSCSKGWTGGACDVCAIGKCEENSRILYIQPSTAEWEDVNSVVTVFGEGFSITENGTYVCTFGRTSVTGQRVSSAVIRCPIPSNLTLGRHVFSIAKPGSFNQIGSSESKPIHFTLYDGCDSVLCQGSCVGPLCICPQGKTGIFCDVIEALPSIDKRFLEHQRANKAFEGVPYVLMLPTMSSSVLRVNSTIPNLNFIASKGIVAWPDPIGAEEPYEITVTAFSPAGVTHIGWNVTVNPEYGVEVQNVTVEGAKAKIRGRLISSTGVPTNRKSPVVIRVRRGDTIDEIRTESDANGEISFDYIPMLPGTYDVTMAHPNVRTDAIQPVQFTIPEINLPVVGESSNSSLTLDIPGKENCQVKLIQPIVDNPEIVQHGNNQWVVNFGRIWNGEVLASVKCGDEPMEIVRAPPIENGLVPTTPEVLSLYGTDQLYEVKIHSGDIPFLTPDVIISDESLEYLSAIPEDDNLRLTFSSSSILGNGTIQVNDGSKPLAIIPYFYAASNKSTYYNFKICVRDEWDGQEGPLASSEVATIAIQNPQKGVDVTRTNVRLNRQWADFSLQPGTYNLLVRSELHEPVDKVVELSPLNTSFCIPLVSSKSRSLPTIHCSHFTDPASCDVEITSVSSSNDNLPNFHFEPSVVTFSGQKILVVPRGNLAGTIGLWNNQIDGISVTPSRRSVGINESFWINFGWSGRDSSSNEDCGIQTLNVPFIFLPESSQIPVHTVSTILVKTGNNDQICHGNDPIQPATSTLVMCNCGDGARSRCRERYHSATACGGAWNKIADDTVSLEVISAFLSMVFECREVSVNFAELQRSLECVSSIESDCPINTKRKRDVTEYQTFQDPQLTPISNWNSVNTALGKVYPVFNTLDTQTIRISSVFMEFVERIQKMFPEDLISSLNQEAVDHFLGSISDQSDEGMYVSEAERRIVGIEGFKLIQLWNLTVKNWKSGKTPTERLGISYQDMKSLVAASDKVKSISRQNIAMNPFSMLHNYMEKMLETGETEQKECATSTVLIDNTEVEEDGQMRILVFIKNKANATLTNIGVTLSFVKANAKTPNVNFNIGPSWSSGISSLTGLGAFNSDAAFEIHWTRFIAVPRRLTTVAKYQPIIIFSFSSMGRFTQQKLFAPEISVIPKKTIRAINIIKDSLSPKEGVDFSIISSIINPGYTGLKNVQVKMDELVFPTNNPPQLESVFVNGKLSQKTLSPKFPEIASGSTQLIRIVMKDGEEIVPVTSMNLTCLENGKLLPMKITETYAIRAAGISDFGMLLATPGQSAPLFYFRPSAAQMVNVIQLEFLSNKKINSTDSSQTTYVAAFRNPESSSFGGALWARMPVPKVGDNHKLTSIVDRGGTRPRELQAVQWITEENGNEFLNWIDSGTSTSQQMIYELEFTNPESSPDNLNPSFDQLQYRIEIPPQNMPPDSEIGLIEADGEDLTYFLYSPDNQKRFSVDSETGRIFFDADEPLGNEEEFCVVLEARDPEGRITRVPVAINNGGQRRDCVLFSTNNLTPMVHFGDYIPMPSTFRPRTIAPITPPTPAFPTLSPTVEIPTPPTFPSEETTTTSAEPLESTTVSLATEGTTLSEELTTSQIIVETSSTWQTTEEASSEHTTELTTPTSSEIPTSSETSSTGEITSTMDSQSSTTLSKDTTSSEDVTTPSEVATSSELPADITETTVIFVDSTLESITTQPMETTTAEEILTSSVSESEVTTPTVTTMEPEGTSPEYGTSVDTSLEPITTSTTIMVPTDFPTPPTPPEQITSSEGTTSSIDTSDFPTPSGEVTLEPVTLPTSGSTLSFPTPPDDFTDYPTSEGTVVTSPDATLESITTSEMPVTSTGTLATTENFETSTQREWTSEITWTPTLPTTETISETTAEITKILPTDPTTTEFVYTVSSDGTLEPVPVTSTMEPITFPITPDASLSTEVTIAPPIHVSTVGGNDVYSTSPTVPTVITSTVGSDDPMDIDCSMTSTPVSAFSVIMCNLQGMSKKKQRSP